MKHVVQFSTGAGSAEVLWRTVEQYGRDDVVALTADTLVEDEDNWRFAREVVRRLRCRWVVLADGRTPMGAGRDERAVPNNRWAICSRVLKRDLLRAWIEEHCDPAATTIYLGYDWTELGRLDGARGPWRPWTVECPLMDPPLLDKVQVLDLFRGRGIEPPRLYAVGFAHANCGGGCVRAGQADWARLLRWNPARYGEWEAEEEATRSLLGKDVAILRDRRGGPTRPLSLRDFRIRLTGNASLFDGDDVGACGCMEWDEKPLDTIGKPDESV